MTCVCPGWLPGTASVPRRAVHVTHQRIPQLLGLSGVEMDLQDLGAAELAGQHRGTITGCVGSDPWRCR